MFQNVEISVVVEVFGEGRRLTKNDGKTANVSPMFHRENEKSP